MKAPRMPRLPRPWPKRTGRVGVALGFDRIYAVRLSWSGKISGPVWSRALEPFVAGETHWPSLAAALVELRGALGVDEARIDVALLPPLVEARRLELPRVSTSQLRRLLARDAERLFLGVCEPQVVGAMALARRGSPAPMLAAVASAALADAVCAAADVAGWRLDGIVPAHAAWPAALTRLLPRRMRSGDLGLIVACDDGFHILRIQGGVLSALRRAPTWLAESSELGAALRERLGTAGKDDMEARTLHVAVIGSPPLCGRFLEAVQEIGAKPVQLPVENASAEALAAAFAGAARGPLLAPDAWHANAGRRSRQFIIRRLAAAAMVCVGAIAVELWGVERELETVRAERRRLGPAVARALERREALEQAALEIETLHQLVAAQRRWSEELVALAEALPGDAYLRAITAEADSVTVHVVAPDGASVFKALATPAAVADARLLAPIRRVERQGGPPVQEVALRLRLASSQVGGP